MNLLLKKTKTILDRWEAVDHDDIDQIIAFLKVESDSIRKRYGNNIAFIPSNVCNECIDFACVFLASMDLRSRGVYPDFTDNLYDEIDSVFYEDESSRIPYVLEIGQ